MGVQSIMKGFNQLKSGANFNAGRKLSTALSNIFSVLHLSRQYSSIFQNKLITLLLTVILIRDKPKYKKNKNQKLQHTFIGSYKNWPHIAMHEHNYQQLD